MTQQNLPPVIIPSFQPDDRIVKLIDGLIDAGFSSFVVVDDGSAKEKEKIFNELKKKPQVTLLRHAVNLGKGAALKMAMNYVLVTYPGVNGVITADGDGQHEVDDIKKLATEMLQKPSSLILGARAFKEGVPLRSRFGNLMTKWVFRFLVGKNLTDTQTGLRGIPCDLMVELLAIPSNRYEFELDMLIVAIQNSFVISEIPISTIYENGNETSHFNPFLDSFRIYFVFLRFVSLSLVVYCTDFLVFTLVYRMHGQMFSSIAFGRVAGALVAVIGSLKFVFKSDKKVLPVALKILVLWLFLLFMSYGLMLVVVSKWQVNVYIARIFIDSILFVMNFLIQRDIIFNESKRFGSNEDALANNHGRE